MRKSLLLMLPLCLLALGALYYTTQKPGNPGLSGAAPAVKETKQGETRTLVTDAAPTEAPNVARPTLPDHANGPKEGKTGVAPITGESAPPINLENNPGAKAAVEALKTGKNPERLNVAFKPKPFDKQAFEANPKAYLDLVEPGRVWDVGDPSKGAKDLLPKGQQVFDIKPLGTIKLAVQAEQLAPVTFTTFDFGTFSNQMTSITVRADKEGVATVDYTAIQGTTGDVDILAASPLSAGQVNFKVTVVKP